MLIILFQDRRTDNVAVRGAIFNQCPMVHRIKHKGKLNAKNQVPNSRHEREMLYAIIRDLLHPRVHWILVRLHVKIKDLTQKIRQFVRQLVGLSKTDEQTCGL